MVLDSGSLRAIVSSMTDAGWQLTTSVDAAAIPNPVDSTFTTNGAQLTLKLFAWRVTAQQTQGPTPTYHGRPPGEFHMQMTLPAVRGRISLPTVSKGTALVLLGYNEGLDDERIFVAFDASKHMSHGRSPSLQVKGSTIERARAIGVAFQDKNNGERVVAFCAEFFAEYIEGRDAFHDRSAGAEASQDPTIEPEARSTLIAPTRQPQTPPILEPGVRKRVFTSVTRAVREARFSRGIRSVYERCAICGFQYDDILQAAHVIPVSDPSSTDDYTNGMALCPTCHTLYDRGYILVDGDRNIHLHPKYVALFLKQGKADSLNELRSRLLDKLYLPTDEAYWPSKANLAKTYFRRRR